MKVYVQWTRGTPTDYEVLDSSAWAGLPRKPVPVGGEIIDDTPGWIMDVNIQGLSFGGADHCDIIDLTDGSGGVVVSLWFNDPDDLPADRFRVEVWTILPLAPDARIGGAINTVQSKVLYLAPAAMTAFQGPVENTVVRPYSEAPPMVNPCHGIWVSPSSLAEHQAAATPHGWREWTEDIDPSELDGDGFVKPQRPQGRYNKARGTITYFLHDTVLASGVHSLFHEVEMEETDVASSTTVNAAVPQTSDALTHVWTTLSGSPNDANWPNGAYRCQLDVQTAMLVDGYGFLTRGGSAGHFARVNSGLTADEQTWTQTEAAFTGTGIKNASRTLDPSAGAAGDRFECLLAADNSDTMMNGSLDVRVDDSDAFADGPWTVAVAAGFVPSMIAQGLAAPRHHASFSLSGRFTSVVAPSRVATVFPRMVRGRPPLTPVASLREQGLFYPAPPVPPDSRSAAVFPQMIRGTLPPLPISNFQLTGLKHIFTAPPGPGALYDVFAPQVVSGRALSPNTSRRGFRRSASYYVIGRFTSVVAPARVIAVFPQTATGRAAPRPEADYNLSGLMHAAVPVVPGALYEVFAPQVISGRAPPLAEASHELIGRFTSVVAPSRVIAVFPQVIHGEAPPHPMAFYDLTGLMHVVAPVVPAPVYHVFAPQIIEGLGAPLPKGSMLVIGFTPTGVVIIAVAGGFFEQDFFN